MSNNEEMREIMLNSILETSPDLVFFKDIDLKYRGGSKAFLNLVGLHNEKELIGKTDFEIFDKKLAEKYIRDDDKILKSGKSIMDYIESIPDQNGKKCFSSTSKYIIRNDEDKIMGIYGIGRDVTAQIELEEERESRRLYRKMFVGILEADLSENKIIRIEGSAWSNNKELVKEQSFTEIVQIISKTFIHEDYKEHFVARYSIDKLMSNYIEKKKEFTHLIFQSLQGTQYRWMELTTRVYFSKVTNTFRSITFFKDLDKEIRKEAALRIKAETDSLTGVLNRNSIIEKINDCIKGYGQHQKHALLFMDLDHFKDINDNLGHAFGDKILKEIAEKLKSIFRVDDLIGRVGGDEFLVFIKNIKSIEEVEERANRIIKSAYSSLIYTEEAVEVLIACSIGISIYDKEEKTLEILYDEADQAMYQAKAGGRNQIAFFEKVIEN